MPSVLITGSNRGLGLEFVKQYAASGYRVFATARAPERAPALVALAKQHDQVSLHAVDIADEASVRALAQSLASEPIDVLLNNAGTMGPKRQSVTNLDAEGMLQTLRVNTVAPLVVANEFLPHVERGQRKLMVAVTSGMGSIEETSGGYHAYRASKAALNMSFRNLALDLKSLGIIAVVINPGWVQTDMGGGSAPTTVQESISKMRHVLDGVTLADSGKFLNYSGGTLPW